MVLDSFEVGTTPNVLQLSLSSRQVATGFGNRASCRIVSLNSISPPPITSAWYDSCKFGTLVSSWFADIISGQLLGDLKEVTQLLLSDFLALGHALQDGIDKEACIREAM